MGSQGRRRKAGRWSLESTRQLRWGSGVESSEAGGLPSTVVCRGGSLKGWGQTPHTHTHTHTSTATVAVCTLSRGEAGTGTWGSLMVWQAWISGAAIAVGDSCRLFLLCSGARLNQGTQELVSTSVRRSRGSKCLVVEEGAVLVVWLSETEEGAFKW